MKNKTQLLVISISLPQNKFQNKIKSSQTRKCSARMSRLRYAHTHTHTHTQTLPLQLTLITLPRTTTTHSSPLPTRTTLSTRARATLNCDGNLFPLLLVKECHKFYAVGAACWNRILLVFGHIEVNLDSVTLRSQSYVDQG